MAFKGVLFDWRGTLFHDFGWEDSVQAGASSIGRLLGTADVRRLAAAISEAGNVPAIQAAAVRADASVAAHRASILALFRTAGIDDELAAAAYERNAMLDANVPYPDVAEVLRELKARGACIAVVSDIHFDLRPHFQHHGLEGLIDAWALSYEHGWVKPEPQAFLTALRMLNLKPDEALMVGDRAGRDGGAIEVGIPTLLLPPVANFSRRGLDVVLKWFGPT